MAGDGHNFVRGAIGFRETSKLLGTVGEMKWTLQVATNPCVIQDEHWQIGLLLEI